MTEFENFIAKIVNDEFRDREIHVDLKLNPTLNHSSLLELNSAILSNPWCRENVEVVSMHYENVIVSLKDLMRDNLPEDFFDAPFEIADEAMEKNYTATDLPEPNEMHQEYKDILGVLHSSIDELLPKSKNVKGMEPNEILSLVMEAILKNQIVAKRQNFFVQATDQSFNSLYQIFAIAGKQRPMLAIATYMVNNRRNWPELFKSKIESKLSEAAKEYLDKALSTSERPRPRLTN